MDNRELLDTFYIAFSKANAEKMVSCYHEEIIFQDPAFGTLHGIQAKNMWRMLLGRNSEIKISYQIISCDEATGKVDWVAHYAFGPNKRAVTNKVQGNFEFKDGKIIVHKDTFDLWKWSQQAMGPIGYLLGWSSFLKKSIQKKTNKLLASFSEKQ